jgi:dolichol kinase
MWARVCLNKHTMAQVIAGASLGVVLTYGQFMLLASQTEFASDITAMAAVAYALIAPSLVLGLAGWMNRLGVRDGLTRKFFHFVGFGSLAFYSNSLTQELLFLFLASGVVYVTVACLAHEGSLWYEGVRRKSDRPLDRLYVVLPMISMVMAIGFTTALLPPTAVLIGMLCVAIGDAVAEPVGSLIGRHTYSVLALVGHKSVRTFEGSIAVAVSTGLVFGLLTSGWVWALLFGVVLAGVEAISPRGTDNLTVFVAASSLSLLLPV